MILWKIINGKVYLTVEETARRLNVTKTILEVAKCNLKKDLDSKKRRYRDLFVFAIEDNGRTWFLEDGVNFFKEKIEAKENLQYKISLIISEKENLQYKISLIISEMESTMGLPKREIAGILQIREDFTCKILANKDLPSYDLCKKIMCRIIEIVNYAPYSGGDWNSDKYTSGYDNADSYFSKVGT